MSATPPQLNILGAAYGPVNVTTTVRSLVKENSLNFTAVHATFGVNPWPGKSKSVVIVYQYAGEGYRTKVVEAGKNVNISYNDDERKLQLEVQRESTSSEATDLFQGEKVELEILGAAYGREVATRKAKSKVKDGKYFNELANNATWGDNWTHVKKTLVVVYKYDGVPMVSIAAEDSRMHFVFSPPLYILGAAYGPSSVTEKVQALVTNRALNCTADTATFGDTSHGHAKTLIIVYQYGNETPKTIIAKQDTTVDFIYTGNTEYVPNTDPAELNLISAVYGVDNVTKHCLTLVRHNSLSITANDTTFKNNWDHAKTFVAVYQYGKNQTMLRIAKQNEKVVIAAVVPTPTYPGLINTSGLLDNNDTIALNAPNDKYVVCDANGVLVASADSKSEGWKLTIEKPVPQKQEFRIGCPNGKYVVVADNNKLCANGNEEEATSFTVSYSVFGGVRLATNGRYIYLATDCSLQDGATDNFSEATAFNIAIYRKVSGSSKPEKPCECEKPLCTFVWHLTEGFFNALGLEPLLSTGDPDPILLRLLQSNDTAWKAVESLITSIKAEQNEVTVIPTALGTIKVLYKQGLLWSIMKFFLNEREVIAVTKIVQKVVHVLSLPESEAALMLKSFVEWAMKLVEDRLELPIDYDCN